jgi:hypothetical protein
MLYYIKRYVLPQDIGEWALDLFGWSFIIVMLW